MGSVLLMSSTKKMFTNSKKNSAVSKIKRCIRPKHTKNRNKVTTFTFFLSFSF